MYFIPKPGNLWGSEQIDGTNCKPFASASPALIIAPEHQHCGHCSTGRSECYYDKCVSFLVTIHYSHVCFMLVGPVICGRVTSDLRQLVWICFNLNQQI